MLLNSCLVYIWQHFGWGPVKGRWGGIASLPESIFLSDLWEIHNMEFSLYTRVPSPWLFFYIVRKWKCKKLFYLEMLRSHENLNFSFFCLVITYHVLVSHFCHLMILSHQKCWWLEFEHFSQLGIASGPLRWKWWKVDKAGFPGQNIIYWL